MPAPAFILELRRKVGHDLLLLPGLAAIVVDDAGRVLLQRRSDNGQWSPICGVLEPGEQPERAIERQVEEETGLRVRAVRLADAATSPVVEYPNGDRAQFLMVAYRCEICGDDGAAARVNDDESLEVRFFPRDQLPPMRKDLRRYIDRACEPPSSSASASSRPLSSEGSA